MFTTIPIYNSGLIITVNPPTAFSNVVNGNNIDLSWTLAVVGTFAIDYYILEHSTDNVTFTPLALAQNNTEVSFVDTNRALATGVIHYYRIKTIDVNGNESFYATTQRDLI